MKKSSVSFEDFLEQLSKVRFDLEVDGNVRRAGSRESRPPKEGSRSKSLRRVRTREEQGQGSFSL